MAFDVMGTVNAIGTMAMVILALGVVGLITFWIWQVTQYKYLVIVREVVNNRTIISHDKARRIRDKDGNFWWKLLKEKVKIPEPGAEAIETTSKGKKFCEFYKLDEAGFFPVKSKKGWAAIENKIDHVRFKTYFADGFEPLTTNQRGMWLHEMREAESYKKMSKNELIAKAIPYIALILILLILLLFAGEFFTPLFQHNERIAAQNERLYESFNVMIDKLDRAVNNRVTLVGEELLSVNQTGVVGVPD